MAEEGAFTKIWEQFAANLKNGWSWSGFERSVMFMNDGDANFTNIANVIGLDQVTDGRSIISVDIDNDGDLDLIGTSSRTSPHLYVLRNDFKTDRHHLFIELHPEKRKNSEGSKLLLTTDDWTQRRDVALGYGYRSQPSLIQHFGLRDNTIVDKLEVTWPGGEVQVFENIPVDQKIILRQGNKKWKSVAHKEHNYNATGRLATVNWHKFWDKLQLLSHPYVKLDFTDQKALNVDEPLNFATGWEEYERDSTVTVVNLWATWCANCRREMPDLVGADLDTSNNIRVLGICMDEDKTDEQILTAIKDWGIEFPVFHYDAEARENLLNIIAPLLSAQGGLALPTSLVLDADGNCRAILQGAIDIENLELYLEQAAFERPSDAEQAVLGADL